LWRWASDELRQRASPLLVCNKRKKRRRVRQVLPEPIILFVIKPIARTPPNYIHANHSEMTGESGSQTIEIPAVAGQPMDADNKSVLTWVSPFAVCNAMKTVGIECKKAMLVRLRCHVRLKKPAGNGISSVQLLCSAPACSEPAGPRWVVPTSACRWSSQT